MTAARTTPRPTHEAPNTVSGLVRKRAEIAGQIEVAQIALRRLIADLDHVDATIRIFAPEIATETIKSRPNPPQHQALRGEVKRTILDALREAQHPLTSADIALHVMAARCLPASDPNLKLIFVRRVCQALNLMRHKGVVRSVEQPGRFLGWELAG